jgi:hypothetical protein
LRAEADRLIAKPQRTVPTRGSRFGGATRFYSPDEVAAIVAVLKPHGDQQAMQITTEGPVSRQPVARPWYGAGEERRTPVRSWRDGEHVAREPEPMGAQKCPCGRDLTWEPRTTGGARPSLVERALCERCGEVVPEPIFSPPPLRGAWAEGFSPSSVVVATTGRRARPPAPTSVQAVTRAPIAPSRPRVKVPLDPLG